MKSRTKAKHALADFREMIDNLNRMVEYLSVTELTEKILEMSQYRLEMQRENTIESKARLENIEEFLSVTMDFEKRNEDKSLISFLTDLALIADIDTLDKDKSEEEQDAVVLMTMHSAKGLEFPVVFIIGMEEGVFPHSRALRRQRRARRRAPVGLCRHHARRARAVPHVRAHAHALRPHRRECAIEIPPGDSEGTPGERLGWRLRRRGLLARLAAPAIVGAAAAAAPLPHKRAAAPPARPPGARRPPSGTA